MPALSEYTNVYNTALNILQKKGYRIWMNEAIDMYCAEKEGWDFMAESPCALLGLIAIYEWKHPVSYSEYWWREDDVRIYGALESTPPNYKPIFEK